MEIPLSDTDTLREYIGEEAMEKLLEEVELLDGASAEFDLDLVRSGDLTPVFFGSALTNFGVEIFLQHFLPDWLLLHRIAQAQVVARAWKVDVAERAEALLPLDQRPPADDAVAWQKERQEAIKPLS